MKVGQGFGVGTLGYKAQEGISPPSRNHQVFKEVQHQTGGIMSHNVPEWLVNIAGNPYGPGAFSGGAS